MDSKLSVSFNVPPMASSRSLDSSLKVEINKTPVKIAGYYGLTGIGNNDIKLLDAINKVVAKYPSFTADYSMHRSPDDLIEAIGTDVFNKQAQNNLREVDLNIVSELYLLLKVARKFHSDIDSAITYSMFNNFERTNRYHYNDNKTLTGGRNPKKTDNSLKTETARTSYFKDVLAYESTRGGGQTFDEKNMFKNIEIESVESVIGMDGGYNSDGESVGGKHPTSNNKTPPPV